MKALGRVLVAAVLVVVAGRLSLPYLARPLIRSDRLEKSDMIVILGSTRLERTLEAGTLYQDGWAPKIWVSRTPDPLRDEIRQKLHLLLPSFLDIQQNVLAQMHAAPAVVVSPTVPENTREEARVIADYVRRNQMRRVIVVTSPYHTARAGSLLDDAIQGSCKVIMRPDRYEPPEPDRWWLRHPDRYDVVTEYLSRIYGVFNRG